MCCRSREPQASDKEWMLGISQRNGRNGFLRQTCPTNLFWAVSLIFRTWAAERLAAPLPTHCCEKLNLDSSLVCSSHIAQLRAQSLVECAATLRDLKLLVRSGGLDFGKEKLSIDHCAFVCSSHIAQLRAQSLHCNKSIQFVETTTS